MPIRRAILRNVPGLQAQPCSQKPRQCWAFRASPTGPEKVWVRSDWSRRRDSNPRPQPSNFQHLNEANLARSYAFGRVYVSPLMRAAGRPRRTDRQEDRWCPQRVTSRREEQRARRGGGVSKEPLLRSLQPEIAQRRMIVWAWPE